MRFLIVFLSMMFCVELCAYQSRVESVVVKTRAPSNRVVTFWYRIPSSYQEKNRRSYRVLVLFGGRNTKGKAEVSGKLGWPKWADEHEVFLVSPGFTDDNYWEPKAWSGPALMKALKQIQKKYNICADKLMFYGYSAGSQCSNLFPAWKPENARAWVSHACGVFHEPTGRMRNVPGLVTCGDADTTRYILSRAFVENCRKKGINIIWKSFPNHPHDVPPDSLKLARAFLAYYHELYLSDLGDRLCGTTRRALFSSATIRRGNSIRRILRKPEMCCAKTASVSLHWKSLPHGESPRNEPISSARSSVFLSASAFCRGFSGG